MSHTATRIAPIPRERLSAEELGLIGAWTGLNYTRVIVKHPTLYGLYIPFLEQLIARSKLTPRERELVCLRTLTLCDEEYECDHHRTIARNAAMTEAEIAAACSGEGEGLSDFDRVVLRATEELVRDKVIGEATWAQLSERYGEAQLIDLVFLCGCYVMLAMGTKSFGVQLESAEEQQQINTVREYT